MRTLFFTLLVALGVLASLPHAAGDAEVPLVFSGGHETAEEDRGRPVVLIAAALQVTPEIFRQSFRLIKPSPPGQAPEPEQVRKNKIGLTAVLHQYGVTNRRLDQVVDHYRYRREEGQMWPVVPATAVATVHDGKIAHITITNPGSGYSSPPQISVAGMPQVHLEASLSFATDFDKNGSIGSISTAPSISAAPTAAGPDVSHQAPPAPDDDLYPPPPPEAGDNRPPPP